MYRGSNSPGCLASLAPLAIVIILWWIIAANISDTRAPRAADTFGFGDAKVNSSTIWFTGFKGCGYGDMKLWRMTGTNPQGKRVDFIVCGGAFKGNTIRVK